MKKNDWVTLPITDITAEGSGVGRVNGLTVFVPFAAVGDTVSAKIIKVKKNYGIARLEEVITPSAFRVPQDCPVFGRCGGCATRHIGYEKECELKQNKVYEAIRRIGGIDLAPRPILAASRTQRYRNKAQYPISKEGKAGFFSRHTHRIAACTDCLLQPQIFGEIMAAVENWIAEFHISIYDESAHRGLLRHVYLRLAENTGEIMFVAVANGDTLPRAPELVGALKAVCGEKLKSVILNTNREKTNVILGERCQVLYGEAAITDSLCGLKVRLSPLSFYQVNREMAERLYAKAAEYADPAGKRVIDLYCGAGTIGLSMAGAAKSVIGVEILPQAVEDARYNAAQNKIANARFLCADAKTAAGQLAVDGETADVVIVDPPRKGCSEELLRTICFDFAPERLVYVSCDPATLARDVAVLSGFGYRLTEYTPVDLFPRTGHVETVVLMTKPDGKK